MSAAICLQGPHITLSTQIWFISDLCHFVFFAAAWRLLANKSTNRNPRASEIFQLKICCNKTVLRLCPLIFSPFMLLLCTRTTNVPGAYICSWLVLGAQVEPRSASSYCRFWSFGCSLPLHLRPPITVQTCVLLFIFATICEICAKKKERELKKGTQLALFLLLCWSWRKGRKLPFSSYVCRFSNMKRHVLNTSICSDSDSSPPFVGFSLLQPCLLVFMTSTFIWWPFMVTTFIYWPL